MSAINVRQKRFVEFFLQLGNGAEAARRAGYSAKHAHRIATRMLSNVHISAAIQARLKELESQRTATTQEVLEHLTAVLRGEVSETVVTNSGKKFTVPVSEKDRLKAADMLLKIRGEYRDRKEIQVNGADLFVRALEKISEEIDSEQGN